MKYFTRKLLGHEILYCMLNILRSEKIFSEADESIVS